jgi:hypothetical protein
MPFTHWSIRKLRAYLADNPTRRVVIGRERLRQILDRQHITFQRTKTWKESNDPLRDAKLDRIEEVTAAFPERSFAFDEFGPLTLHPVAGCCWAERKRPQRLRANYHKHCGVRQFHACYSYAEDTVWGVVRQRKSVKNSLAAIASCRAARPDGRADLRHLGQPLRPQVEEDRRLVCPPQRRAVLHPHLQLLGQPDRVPLRAVARLRAEQLRLPDPRRAYCPAACLPALAQRQCPGSPGFGGRAQASGRDAR